MEALKKSVAEVGARKMAPSVKAPEAAEAAETSPRKKRTRKTG
jgi:hypothetical protein